MKYFYKYQNFYLLLLLISFVLCANTVFAATVFGPRSYSISRWHCHFSFNTFSVSNEGAGELLVSKGAGPIKSGFILYNFRVIRLKKFLMGSETTLAVKVGLKKKNRFFVFLRGKPGASISISVKQGSGIQPPTAVLTAEPASIVQGESASLIWSTSNADTVSIEPGIGVVDHSGSISVSPLATTNYILSATGAGGAVTAQATVNVIPPQKPTVSITAVPELIAPGSSSTLSWVSENADKCTIEPDIGDVPVNGNIAVNPTATTNYIITAIGSGGVAKAQVDVQVYPIQVHEISKPQANYKTPENTIAASTSALIQHDLDWFYSSFTAEAAIQDKKMFQDAGIDPVENFKLAPVNGVVEYITDKIPYKDGIVILLEKRINNIDGSIIKGWAGLILENDLWKVTYKFSQDEELFKYNDVVYTNCIANYSFLSGDFLEDSSWHNNDLTNYNKTAGALDQRYGKDLTVAELNGINNGFSREPLNDMPRDKLSMGGWIKADSVDHTARILEIGRDRDDSTAIVLNPGKGLRYWIHVNGNRVERTAAMDYDFHDNQWHHVYLTYDGATMNLYVDGQLKDSYPVSGVIDSQPVLNIGQRNAAVNNGTADTFKGRLDDIQIYNKALTPEQIMKKYENGTTQPL
ncbi:MAG TPA: LamG domain-containing protein [Gammaproteobacteria bacterium]|nr:LamG domain-containing protein [Gammaproteobacteria bacterium]